MPTVLNEGRRLKKGLSLLHYTSLSKEETEIQTHGKEMGEIQMADSRCGSFDTAVFQYRCLSIPLFFDTAVFLNAAEIARSMLRVGFQTE